MTSYVLHDPFNYKKKVYCFECFYQLRWGEVEREKEIQQKLGECREKAATDSK